MMNLDVVRSTLGFNHSDEIPSNPDDKFPNCNENYMKSVVDPWYRNVKEPIMSCRNTSDCKTENGVLRFCNHDRDLWGHCEECTSMINNFKQFFPGYKLCFDEGFICERGENSCIETCEGNEY